MHGTAVGKKMSAVHGITFHVVSNNKLYLCHYFATDVTIYILFIYIFSPHTRNTIMQNTGYKHLNKIGLQDYNFSV